MREALITRLRGTIIIKFPTLEQMRKSALRIFSKEAYQKVLAHLREAIKNGFISESFEGNFPRFVWSNAFGDGIIYEARLTNKELGIYKGYPRSDLTSIPE